MRSRGLHYDRFLARGFAGFTLTDFAIRDASETLEASLYRSGTCKGS